MKDNKSETIAFTFKLGLSGAEFANPSRWFSGIFTPIGSEIKNSISQIIRKTIM